MFSTVDIPSREIKGSPQFPVEQSLQSWCNTLVLIGIMVVFFLGNLHRSEKTQM